MRQLAPGSPARPRCTAATLRPVPPRPRFVVVGSTIALSLVLAAIGRKGDQPKAAQELGFPQFATKNTTRVGGADPTADAAAVAQAVFTPELPSARPRAVALVDSGDWQAGVAASVLMSRPLRAPILLSGSDSLPDATKNALSALDPTGARQVGGAKVIRVGSVPVPSGLRSTQVAGANPFAIAAGVDRLA